MLQSECWLGLSGVLVLFLARFELGLRMNFPGDQSMKRELDIPRPDLGRDVYATEFSQFFAPYQTRDFY